MRANRQNTVIWRIKAVYQLAILCILLSISTSARAYIILSEAYRDCNGDAYGLCDSNGKVILPAKYSILSYVGNGIYFAAEFNPGDRFIIGTNRYLVDQNGSRMAFTLPPDAILVGVSSLGKAADSDPSQILNKLPSDSVLNIWEEERMHYYDPQGRPSHPPTNARQYNAAFIDPIKVLKYTRAIAPNIKETEGTEFAKVAEDRVIKRVLANTGKFMPDYFQKMKQAPYSRVEMFGRFLKEYSLVGMEESTVRLLLGYPAGLEYQNYSGEIKSLTYNLYSSTGCLQRDGSHVKINFNDNKVTGWYCYTSSKQMPLVTKNMMFATVPKEVNEDYLPELVAK